MKAIIDIAHKGSIFDTVRAQLAEPGETDYYLSFESARTLFAELTPARIDLLDALHRNGPCSIYALAKHSGRNYSNVHADVARLLDLGLAERTEDDLLRVPFESLEIRMRLSKEAA